MFTSTKITIVEYTERKLQFLHVTVTNKVTQTSFSHTHSQLGEFEIVGETSWTVTKICGVRWSKIPHTYYNNKDCKSLYMSPNNSTKPRTIETLMECMCTYFRLSCLGVRLLYSHWLWFIVGRSSPLVKM